MDNNNNNESSAIGRFGYVSDYDAERHMARIEFPDKGDLVSAWLPVAVPNSHKNKDECHLDIDEHVFCLMMGNGLEAGVVLGSIYDDTNKPPIGNSDIRKITFEDGTEISYDRKNNELKIICKGNMNINADGNIKITASRIDLN